MTHDELLDKTCSGDSDAKAFLTTLVALIHCWDDLIDRDKTPTGPAITAAFMAALFDVPENQFFRRFEHMLRPVMRKAAMDWMIATNMENAKPTSSKDLEITYIARSAYIDVFTMTAFLTGGQEHAVTLGPELRRAFHHEGFSVYAQNLRSSLRVA